jgi:hypothetical protein
MARLVGIRSEPERQSDADPEGGSVGPVVRKPSPPTAALKTPTVEEILASIGVNNEALKAKIAELLLKFPNGIPQSIIFDLLNNTVSTPALYAKLGEVYVAAVKFSQTGKGPVGHASVEVV